MKYNRSLDFAARAILAMRKGKQELAAQYFTEAAAQSDAIDAVKIIEASNQKAFEALTAAKKPAAKPAVKAAAKPAAKPAVKTEAAKRLKASDEMVEDEMIEDELVESEAEDEVMEEDLVTDLSELDEVEAADEMPVEEEMIEEEGEDTSEAFAKVLSSMQRRKAAKK